MVEKVYVTWEQVLDYVNDVANWVRKNNLKPSGVLGIPRGGMILATLLSYKLDIPLLLGAAPNCIVIDDIADSGRTLSHYTDNDTQFNKYFITTMYYHNRSIVTPDFWVYEKENKWIVFPWEFDEN